MDKSSLITSAITAAGPSGKLLNWMQNNRNVREQKNQNALDRQAQSDMYNRQRTDALDDWQREMAMWEKTNEYNSPKQQMQRFREAGLNPNLIYGQGTTAQKPEPPRATSGNHPNQQAPQVDYSGMAVNGEGLMRILLMQANTENTQANTDNLKVINDNLQLDTRLKELGIDTSNIRKRQLTLDYNKSQETYQASVKKSQLDNDMLEANIAGRKASTAYTLSANERAQIAQSLNIKQTLQNIIESKMRVAKGEQELENLKRALKLLESDEVIKQWEIGLQNAGVTKGGGIVANAASIFGTLWNNLLTK